MSECIKRYFSEVTNQLIATVTTLKFALCHFASDQESWAFHQSLLPSSSHLPWATQEHESGREVCYRNPTTQRESIAQIV